VTKPDPDKESRPVRNAIDDWAREHGYSHTYRWCSFRREWQIEIPAVEVRAVVSVEGAATFLGSAYVASTPNGVRRVLDEIAKDVRPSRT